VNGKCLKRRCQCFSSCSSLDRFACGCVVFSSLLGVNDIVRGKLLFSISSTRFDYVEVVSLGSIQGISLGLSSGSGVTGQTGGLDS
jgi:hypothetical protein